VLCSLHEIRKELEANKDSILRANGEDMAVRCTFTHSETQLGEKERVTGAVVQRAEAEVGVGRLASPLVKRQDFRSGEKWDTMLQGVTDIASLPDPTGTITYARALHDNLDLYRVSCPIGVLLVIFEARPEVIVNIAALALKSGTCTTTKLYHSTHPSSVPYATHLTCKISRTHACTGNAAILKGGKESARTAAELARTIQAALARTTLPGAFIQTVETRAEVTALLSQAQDRYIDLVIPTGATR
jgi:glutamate-5-semialdehyde dehydrogenase